jgi:hypothetical protein
VHLDSSLLYSVSSINHIASGYCIPQTCPITNKDTHVTDQLNMRRSELPFKSTSILSFPQSPTNPRSSFIFSCCLEADSRTINWMYKLIEPLCRYITNLTCGKPSE